MTVQSKLEYTLEKARSARNHKLVFFNDIVKTNGGVNLDFMKIIHQSVLGGCDGFYVEYQPIVTSEGGKIAGAEARGCLSTGLRIIRACMILEIMCWQRH